MNVSRVLLVVLGLVFASNSFAQIGIPASDWQADLKFLQNTVHSDYPFLFKKTTAEEFDSAVEELYQQIPKLQEHEIITGLARIVSSFKYGHTELDIRHSSARYHQLPLNLYSFSDGIYIEGAHSDYKNLLGARIVKLNGTPINEALEAIQPVVPVENEQYFKAHGLNYLGIPEILHAQGVIDKLKNDIEFTVEKDGKTFEQIVTAVKSQRFPVRYGFVKPAGDWLSVRDPSKTPRYLKNLDKIYYFEHLPEHDAVYVRHSQIQDEREEPIPDFYQRVFERVEQDDVDKLIIDLRLNGGGNNYKNKPIVTGIIRTDKINKPGKLFVIIGRRTFSACQNLVNELDSYTNAIFVGEPTAENINFYGDNRRVVLPNSEIPVHLSFAWWQDKPQWEGEPWTAPHLAVEMSFEDYRSNQDPVLETALNFSDDEFLLDPMAYLRDLFETQQIEKLEAEAKRIVSDPKYKFIDFEVKFNEAGYDLMSDGRFKEAIYVLQQNTKMFPTSANAWDSLGEAHWKDKQIDKAIEYYNKAIALDPDGAIGDNARRMLKQVKAEIKSDDN